MRMASWSFNTNTYGVINLRCRPTFYRNLSCYWRNVRVIAGAAGNVGDTGPRGGQGATGLVHFGRFVWIDFMYNSCTYTKPQDIPYFRGVYSDTTELNLTELNSTQLNWTQLTQFNSEQPSQSCFCLWRHDLQTESTGSLRSLISDSCSCCERVDNSTSSWVELRRW